MEVVMFIIGVTLFALWLWLCILATIAVRHDATLESTQKKGQTVIVWLFPFVGASFILYLVWQHYPNAIPKAWVPWPFKRLIYGPVIAPNHNRDDNEHDGVHRSRNHSGNYGGGGGENDGGD